jgi:heme-degrading monooxygenase HmoA
LISRHWKGVSRRDQAEAYVAHLRDETFPALRAIPGFVRASILRREVAAGTEFQVVTVWESLEAIRAFAGPDVEAAVVPEAVQRMMVAFEARASHYEVAHETDQAG